jgi:hypothetical protein
MNEEILKELAEINSHLKDLQAEIQKLASVLEKVVAQRAPNPDTAFHKRS